MLAEFSTGANNGKITSTYEALNGETISYTYDSLNRMVAASSKIGQTVDWAEGYTFDPYGNLTAKTVTGESGPSMSTYVNEATNQVGSTDANGNTFMANAAYDVENHIYALVGEPPYTSYSYDGQGKRIFMWGGISDSNNNPTTYSVVAYSPSGQKLGTYEFIPGRYAPGGVYEPFIGVSVATSDQYFGGRRLASMDQLGSVGTYYPWGEAKGTTNPQDTWSYATYWRDSVTGLDYANNRYYSNAYGRFMTPDPYVGNGGGAGSPTSPQSWNRYAYVTGDPINTLDPSGLYGCSPDDPTCTTGCDPSDPSCGDPGCDPSDPSCSSPTPPSPSPKGPTPPAPTPVPCNSTVGSLAGALGGTAACDTGVGPNVELFTSLSDFNSFLGGLGLPQLAGTGGVISIGGVEIGWGEIAIGVLDPEVVISIAAVAGAVAIYNYYESSYERLQRCVAQFTQDLKNCRDAYPPNSPGLKACSEAAQRAYRACMKKDVN